MKSNILRPYDYIDNTINIMIIEDESFQAELITEILEPVQLFSLYTVTTNKEAVSLFRSGKRFHVCILDLGISDIDNDEFYILRNYTNHCSVIVRTGSDSPKKGATCIQLGAKTVIEKGTMFDTCKFYQIVSRNALLNIVNFRYNESSGDTLNLATKVLFEKNPDTVTQWADYMRITDRQLRNLWRTGSGFGAKQVLSLYHLFKDAFNYYKIDMFGDLDEHNELKNFSDKSSRSYFENNREILTFLFS
ncbi:MAG TPA: response regulator [Chitinispirillaceae bacterium]|nr:response regulator [Chitinispirillaceae bacterium]